MPVVLSTPLRSVVLYSGHWYSSGCEEDLKRLRDLMDALSKDFRLLLQIMSVRR